MTPRLLHISKDEKFIDGALELFEAVAPGENALVVQLPLDRTQPARIKRTERVSAVHHGPQAIQTMAAELPRYAGVIVHGLDKFTTALMEASPATPFFWLAWGYDLYNRFPDFRTALYQPATQEILRTMRGTGNLSELAANARAQLFRLSLPLLQLSPRGQVGRNVRAALPFARSLKSMLSCINRMSACATVLPDEWPLVKRLGFRGEFFRYNYAWMEQLFPSGPLLASGPNFLVGNSSSASGNHVDTFQALARLDLRGRKVVVPLSYGNETYREHVLRRGSAILGDAFMPLLDFMPLAEYNRVLESCGTVIMNHHRQQAVGNIMSALHMGARVFLNELNPCHAFFSRIGARVFSLQAEGAELGRAEAALPEAVVAASRAALGKEYSKAVSLERAHAIVRHFLPQHERPSL